MEKTSTQILLIEDSAMNAQIMNDMLREHGFEELKNVTNAEDAISYLEKLHADSNEKNKVQLIVTNIVLTGMSGIELLRYVKTHSDYMHIPVIMMSTIDNPEVSRQAFELGVSDFVIRPCKCEVIVGRIKGILSAQAKIDALTIQHEKSRLMYYKVVEDLNIASQIQMQLLPNDLIKEDCSIHGIYLPYDQLGGDLYYWKELDNGKYGIVMIDVMGHGTATALICMYLRSLLTDIFIQTEDAKTIIHRLNQIIVDFNKEITTSQFHCTAFVMIIDLKKHYFDYINAGHPYGAYIVDNDEVIWLKEGCIPLGIFDSIEVTSTRVPIYSNSKLFLYSDGIYELLHNQQIDIHYVLQYIKIYGDIEKDGQGLLRKVKGFIEQSKRNDDVSMIYMEFN